MIYFWLLYFFLQKRYASLDLDSGLIQLKIKFSKIEPNTFTFETSKTCFTNNAYFGIKNVIFGSK